MDSQVGEVGAVHTEGVLITMTSLGHKSKSTLNSKLKAGDDLTVTVEVSAVTVRLAADEI